MLRRDRQYGTFAPGLHLLLQREALLYAQEIAERDIECTREPLGHGLIRVPDEVDEDVLNTRSAQGKRVVRLAFQVAARYPVGHAIRTQPDPVAGPVPAVGEGLGVALH